MGSSETGAVAECSVGSIVWVRRRNGSWWPGKILGPEELSSSFRTSPRSGTPVKLLGREDASVDWYNLEKSKRVKAFRCGEFDDCIERAEAAQGMPPKKREKYARREDAIMHALELERQLLDKNCEKLGYSSHDRIGRSPDAVTSSIYLDNASGNHNGSRLDQLPHKVGLSLSDKNIAYHTMYEKTVREGNQLSGDDDSAGVLPRMRGLRDFGLRTATSREELPGVAFRSKRSRNAYLPYGSVDYFIDDQTLSFQLEMPVSKIEENSYSQVDLGENHVSGSAEDTETNCSETNSLESDSDDEMTVFSDGSASMELHPKYPGSIGTPNEHASISSTDDFDESAFADSLPHPFQHGHVSTNAGVFKGKRNLKSSNWNHCVPDIVDRNFKSHASRYGPTSPHRPCEFADFEGKLDSNSHSAVRSCRYWDGPTLIDVDLIVQANNYSRNVPMISLMSKLNGHAIVGHPIQIEALQSGSTVTYVTQRERIIERNDNGKIKRIPVPSPAPLTSKWRTGRRTVNSRVPRPFLTSMLNNGKGRDTTHRGSNQKIRALSSFSLRQHHSDSSGGGLIENGNTCTVVSCIPVKLAFIRLHEDLSARHQ